MCKLMGPDDIHPRVVKKLDDVVAKPTSIIFVKLWLTGKVPGDWNKGNITPIFKKKRKEDPGTYRSVSLTSMLGKIMEKIILEEMLNHMRDEQGI